MALYNLLSCSGFEGSDSMIQFGTPCMMGRLGIVILFFIIAIIRRWGGEEVGLSFNMLLACLGGIPAYFIAVLLLGSVKIGFVIGLGVALLFGYGGGSMFGGGDGE